ncbi:MAG: hypothetical protein BGO78_10590 [Chloroflexi bacterium 44-23]|nr:MAG: hypothetical protein BGO78_10590 [Chloroflexi bacterium 44-23]
MSTRLSRRFYWLALILLLAACQSQPSPTIIPVAIDTQTALSPTLTATVLPSETLQATEIPLPTAWPTATAGPTPMGGSEQIMFSIALRKGESYQYQGVYHFNLLNQQINTIFGEGYAIQMLSPDGNWILANQGSKLFLAGRYGSSPIQLSNAFYQHSLSPAIWNTDGSQIFWIENASGSMRVIEAEFSGREVKQAADFLQDQSVELLWADDQQQFAWLQGTCNSGSLCRGEVLVNGAAAGGYSDLGEAANPVFDRSHTRLAFTNQHQESPALGIQNGANTPVHWVDLDGDIPVDYSWSPDGNRLALLGQIRSDYSGRNFGNQVLILQAPHWKPVLITELEGISARLTWSPDGNWILFSSTLSNDQGYQVQMALIDPLAKKVEMLALPMVTTSDDYIFIPRLFWLP